MDEQIHIELTIPAELAGKRLDQAVASLLSDYSRVQIQDWITRGYLTVNGQNAISKLRLKGQEQIIIDCALTIKTSDKPQAIKLDIIFEDDEILVINKPAGLVVHPGAGNLDNTLLNALLHHHEPLQLLPRAGIIHRIDKDTTGLLCIAKTTASYHFLSEQLQNRLMKRHYHCMVRGHIVAGGTITAPMGRDPNHRTKMAVVENGKPAKTIYRIAEKFKHYSYLFVNIETGRTHQIRVHMAHIKHPIIGDPNYGGRQRLAKGIDESLRTRIQHFKRQALHASKLCLEHPVSHTSMSFEAPIPDDMQQLLQALRQYDPI